jgi:Putative peptidoglycan binding domain
MPPRSSHSGGGRRGYSPQGYQATARQNYPQRSALAQRAALLRKSARVAQRAPLKASHAYTPGQSRSRMQSRYPGQSYAGPPWAAQSYGWPRAGASGAYQTAGYTGYPSSNRYGRSYKHRSPWWYQRGWPQSSWGASQQTLSSDEPSGDELRQIQGCLNQLTGGNLGSSGQMDVATRRAIRIFQSQNGLYATGFLGARTLRAIRRACGGSQQPSAPTDAAVPTPQAAPDAAPTPDASQAPAPGGDADSGGADATATPDSGGADTGAADAGGGDSAGGAPPDAGSDGQPAADGGESEVGPTQSGRFEELRVRAPHTVSLDAGGIMTFAPGSQPESALEGVPGSAGIYVVIRRKPSARTGERLYIGAALSLRHHLSSRLRVFTELGIPAAATHQWLEPIQIRWHAVKVSGSPTGIQSRRAGTQGPWKSLRHPTHGALRVLKQYLLQVYGKPAANHAGECVRFTGGSFTVTFPSGRTVVLTQPLGCGSESPA